MRSEFVSVVYDRKKRVSATGEGKVEVLIYFSKSEKKYITVNTCTPHTWKRYQLSSELRTQVAMYHEVVQSMVNSFEPLTIANLNHHLGIEPKETGKNEKHELLAKSDGFIVFMEECIKKEKFSAGTMSHKKVVIDALLRFGRLSRFRDLTPENIKAFDEFLCDETGRTRTTLHNYHKNLRKYVRMAFQMGYISTDPYLHPLCHFDRGKSKERRPLTEEELVLLRDMEGLTLKEVHARDLFIFCAYTGLSYADSQVFDFDTMTEKLNDYTYIDGKRVKTGNTYFTPILPPAMEILEKYNFKLPHMSNQKANDFLHLLECRLPGNKPLTMHVARHSFATLALSYDIPIENVARMLGHSNIKTTQIYAHILHSTIARHTESFASRIR
ncbi:MAG: site-specific integrase [Bacteroidaceae bacterium]|nr:site-specific integrase [Bacteroidaceae bacterium]